MAERPRDESAILGVGYFEAKF